MSAERSTPPGLDPFSLNSILDRLACPVCLGGLRLGDSRLHCEGCGRVYPVVDGIPVLIPDRADKTQE